MNVMGSNGGTAGVEGVGRPTAVHPPGPPGTTNEMSKPCTAGLYTVRSSCAPWHWVRCLETAELSRAAKQHTRWRLFSVAPLAGATKTLQVMGSRRLWNGFKSGLCLSRRLREKLTGWILCDFVLR